jgi:hypothetical protein
MNWEAHEGSDDGLIQGTIPEYHWMNWEKPRTVLVRPWGDIWNRNLSNKMDLQPLEHNRRFFSELFSVWMVISCSPSNAVKGKAIPVTGRGSL